MCELMAVAWDEPQRFGDVLPWALGMERLGLAGFGWGVAWIDDNGRVRGYRNPSSLAEDEAGSRPLRDVRSTRFLVHLRRPSKLSTIQEADSQPFLDESGDFAFCHNGLFKRAEELRPQYAGRLLGRADSEVGFRYFQDRMVEGAAAGNALRDTLEHVGGSGNLGYVGAEGSMLVLAGHPHNLVWRYRMGGATVAATALHSDDESLFDLLFEHAADREKIEQQVIEVGGPERQWRAPAAS